ncbi:hypothetical protein ARSEF4850_008971 [Beauveria asiatica]
MFDAPNLVTASGRGALATPLLLQAPTSPTLGTLQLVASG